MRAVRLHGVRDLRHEEVPPPPPPGPVEVLLRVTAAGICGSDLHNFATGQWITRTPSVAGHELTGIVESTGEGVDHVAPGQAVLVDSRVTCGTCRGCLEGLSQVCERMGFVGEVIDGGFAERVLLPARLVLPAPEGVPARHLAMAEPLAVALHALRRLGAPAGAPIAVVGCGGIGALAAMAAAGAGHPLLLIDRNDARARRVAEVTDGTVAALSDLGPRPPRFGIDATGEPEAIGGLMEALAPGGGIALVGIGSRALGLMPARLVDREMSLMGCHAFGDELASAGALLKGLGDALERLIDREIRLEEVPAAYERHLAGQVEGAKTIVLPTRGAA